MKKFDHNHSIHLTNSRKAPRSLVLVFVIGTIIIGLATVILIAEVVYVAYKNSVPAYMRTPLAGQALTTNLYNIAVSKPKLTQATDPAFKIPPGYQNVIVELTMTNKSAIPLDFFPVQQTFLRDDAGDIFQMVPSMVVTKPYPAGEVGPGSTVKGEVSYQVPINTDVSRNLKIYIDPRWGDMQPVVFDLGLNK